MATNELAVVAVDPAYTSRWGAEHWLGALKKISSDALSHHAAALVIGRRGLKQQHGDGNGVPRPHQRMGKRELPTPPCGPRRQIPAWLSRETGSPEPARPEGGHTYGTRPNRPTGAHRTPR
jgi:hypothetical protein